MTASKIIIKVLATFAFFLLLNTAFSSNALALECSIANFDQQTRNLTACVGGFNSVAEINGTVVRYNCLANSNIPDALIGICQGIQMSTFTLSGYYDCIGQTADCPVGRSATGYYVCPKAQAVSRAIGRMSVSFIKGSNTCTTAEQYTRPANWDPLTEGLPWQGPQTGLSVTCPDGKSINTALGCIDTSDFGGTIGQLLNIAIGLGGGLSLILMAYGVFIVTTSSGMPDKLNEGKNIITAAAGGLIFVVLSVVLYRLIGIQILQLPGLE